MEQIKKAVALHPYGLILREKDLTDEEYESLATKVIKLCREQQVCFFLHSRWELAERLGCKNIHLSLASFLEAKEDLKKFEQISVSCHSIEDVKKAIDCGATQIVLGTIFETECKKGLKGKGLAFVKEVSDYCKSRGDVPVFAIGGITPENLELVKSAGARGGCMMSYMMKPLGTDTNGSKDCP